jgi:hypothetical protein
MAGDVIMKGWIGAAFVASVLLAGPASAEMSAVAPQVTKQTTGTAKATDVSARRHYRRYYHYGYRPYYRPSPYYYARPYYYRPYPYNAPAPFTFGFGFGPFW